MPTVRPAQGYLRVGDALSQSPPYAHHMTGGGAAIFVILFYLVFVAVGFYLLYLAIRYGVAHGMRDSRRASTSSATPVGSDEQ